MDNSGEIFHYVFEHGEVFYCVCGESTTDKAVAIEHVQRDLFLHKCRFCTKVTRHQAEMKRHERKSHERAIQLSQHGIRLDFNDTDHLVVSMPVESNVIKKVYFGVAKGSREVSLEQGSFKIGGLAQFLIFLFCLLFHQIPQGLSA